MECPKCGYELYPWDKECPKCKRLGELRPSQPPTADRASPPSTAAADTRVPRRAATDDFPETVRATFAADEEVWLSLPGLRGEGLAAGGEGPRGRLLVVGSPIGAQGPPRAAAPLVLPLHELLLIDLYPHGNEVGVMVFGWSPHGNAQCYFPSSQYQTIIDAKLRLEERAVWQKVLAGWQAEGDQRLAAFVNLMIRKPYSTPGDRTFLDWANDHPDVEQTAKDLYSREVWPQQQQTLLGDCVRVGPRVLPALFNLYERCCARLASESEQQQLFVAAGAEFNAWAAGVSEFAVCLTSGVAESFSDEEKMFVIGHELGHVACEHQLYTHTASQLAEAYRSQAEELMVNAGEDYLEAQELMVDAGEERLEANLSESWLLSWVGRGAAGAKEREARDRERQADVEENEAAAVLDLAGSVLGMLDAWMPEMELSADRAGLICCGSVEAATSAMVKLALGSAALARHVDVDAYLAQYDELLERGIGTDVAGRHPLTVKRCLALREWHSQEIAPKLIEVADWLEAWEFAEGSSAEPG